MLADFQAALARLYIDPSFRKAVISRDEAAFVGLARLEAERLRVAAVDESRAVIGGLVAGFRFAKIVTLLPVTRRALGDARLVREVRRYFASHPPESFYAPEEALGFCDHLLARADALRVPRLREIVSLERAIVVRRRPQPGDDDLPPTPTR